ncbi:MAG: FliG C-terminal domain-containing protein [Planctomycetota bacterium]
MALTGKQKAAMLLMSLDAATAAELLKGVNPELVQELAMELTYLDAAGYQSGEQSAQIAQQFCNSLQADEEFHLKSFLKTMLKNTVGDEKAGLIQTKIRDLGQERDPFIRIRSIDSQKIASVLEKEHPRAAAAVLSELPAKKSSDVLDLFGESIRLSAVRRMAACKNMTAQAKTQIAETVCKRIEAVTADAASSPHETSFTISQGETLPTRLERFLRKTTLIVQNMGKELRDRLIGTKEAKGDKAGETKPDSMIAWENIPQVDDRLLQKTLRGVNARILALALIEADYRLVQKITSNISEQAAAALNEQASHLSPARKKDIEEAREEIVRVLQKGLNKWY